MQSFKVTMNLINHLHYRHKLQKKTIACNIHTSVIYHSNTT